jgi:hypothetical protein
MSPPAETTIQTDASVSAIDKQLSDITIPQSGNSEPPLRWYHVRLWLVSLLCFLAAAICDMVLRAYNADTFPLGLILRLSWCGTGLALFLTYLLLEVKQPARIITGVIELAILFFLSLVCIWGAISK